MPTENELKFVLNVDSEKLFSESTDIKKIIKQGYLFCYEEMVLRLRSINDENFEMCFKKFINNRVIEIETKVDRRDFLDLWPETTNRIHKIRYEFYFRDDNGYFGNKWEIDAFKAEEHTYFLMAEHEMFENQKYPDFIPDIISENLLFAAPQKDARFSSKRLANVKYAKEIYSQLTRETKNDAATETEKRV